MDSLQKPYTHGIIEVFSFKYFSNQFISHSYWIYLTPRSEKFIASQTLVYITIPRKAY